MDEEGTYKSNHEAHWPEDPGRRALLRIRAAVAGTVVQASYDWYEGEHETKEHHNCTQQLDQLGPLPQQQQPVVYRGEQEG